MKAKEYIKMCEGLDITSDTEVLVKKMQEVWKSYMLETSVMMKARGVQGLYGVLNELDNKWKSICNNVNFLDKNMFRREMVSELPAIRNLMMWSEESCTRKK